MNNLIRVRCYRYIYASKVSMETLAYLGRYQGNNPKWGEPASLCCVHTAFWVNSSHAFPIWPGPSKCGLNTFLWTCQEHTKWGPRQQFHTIIQSIILHGEERPNNWECKRNKHCGPTTMCLSPEKWVLVQWLRTKWVNQVIKVVILNLIEILWFFKSLKARW